MPLLTKTGNRQLRKNLNDKKQSVKDYTRKLRFGRTEFSPKAKSFLEQHADKSIVSMTINRDPIPSAIQGLLNILSIGKVPYDKLFHLRLQGKLQDGTSFIVEKNEVINLDTKIAPTLKNGDSIHITEQLGFTINYMLERCQERMGDDFFRYSVLNNCQAFIKNCLESMNINQYSDWVKQDTKVIFENKPMLRKFSNTLTDIAGRADVIMQGGDIKIVSGGRICFQRRGRNGRLKRL